MYLLPPMPATIRPLTNEEGDWLDKLHPDAVDSPERCITCSGNKTFRWYARAAHPQPDIDPQTVVDFECPCDEQYLTYRRMLYCGIGTSYQRLSWDDFYDLPAEHLGVASDYLENLAQYFTAGLGLILHGPDRGTGKTMFELLLAKQVIARGCDVYVTTFGELLDSYTGTFRDKDQRQWFAARVRNAGLLAVDDLGREYRGVHEIGESALEDVLRHRVQHGLATILSTNLTPDKIESSYGPHTGSVLAERSIYVPFTGVDRRAQTKGRLLDEIRAGLTRPVVIA